MKKRTHILNIALSLCLMGISIGLLFCAGSMETGADLFPYITGTLSLLFGLVLLLCGTVLPKEETCLPEKYRKVGRGLLIINLLLNRHVAGMSVVDTVEGRTPFRRSWNFMVYLLLLVIVGPVVAFHFVGEDPLLHGLTIAWYVVMGLLMISSTLWQSADERERTGRCGWGKIAKQYGVVLCVVLVVAVAAVIWDGGSIGGDSHRDDSHSDITQGQEPMDKQEETGFSGGTEYADLEEAEQAVRGDFLGEKAYYCVREMHEEQTGIFVWTDVSDEVTVYLFRKSGGHYIAQSAFVSEKITKQDVLGQENGVWEP